MIITINYEASSCESASKKLGAMQGNQAVMSIRKLARILTCLGIFLCLSAETVLAVRGQEESLRGLNGVMVEVEILTELMQDGLAKNQIQSDVMSQLQDAGIKVYSPKELKNIPGQPFIFIKITGAKIQDNWKFYTYSINVYLLQDAYLARDTQSDTYLVSTWFRGLTGHGYLDDIRVRVKEIISIFINTYLSVNPN